MKHESTKKRTKHLSLLSLICLTLLLLLFSTACANESEDEVFVLRLAPADAVSVSVTQLASNVRADFYARQEVDFLPPLLNLAPDHAFYIDVNFDVRRSDVEYLFSVYVDSALTEQLWVQHEILRYGEHPEIPAGHSRVIVRPSHSPVGSVQNSFFDMELMAATGDGRVTLTGGDERFLHEPAEGSHWGFLPHFYLVSRMDSSGESWRRPQVTIFTLEHELEAPHSEFFVTETGNGGFRWNAIDGADYYLIVRIDANVSGRSTMAPIGRTTETSWTAPEQRFGAEHYSTEFYGALISMNNAFRWTFDDVNYSVIAVNNHTHSSIGNLHDGNTIMSVLPHRWDWEIEPLEAGQFDKGLVFFVHDFGTLPTHRPLSMVDGEIVQRRMLYDWERAEISDEAVLWIDEDTFWQIAEELGFTGFDFTDEMWDMIFDRWDEMLDVSDDSSWESDYSLHIPFVIEGTQFKGYMAITNVNIATYRADLAVTRARIEEAAARGGGITTLDLIRALPDEEDVILPPPDDDSKTVLINPGDHIYANSALSAFLAYNMLAVNGRIDLSYFPESANLEYLWDAFFEAIYQNPLILHVSGARVLPGAQVLLVEYKEPVNTIIHQQESIRQIVPEIVAEIITAGMTDLEKSMAINQFLIETVEYDWAALENAELHDFRTVDPRYNDSFTAYGILINRVGVCSGYAAAYKLLADAAGLQSIVVTGYLEGFLPHAWNRVYIDGQWHTVDVTNNANPYLFNAFLHLPDEVAAVILVEDRKFVLDYYLRFYRSNSSRNEYFYITHRFYSVQTIAQALARDIQSTGSATLRTSVTLCDAQFEIIMMEVLELSGNSSLYGMHMLGVIFMTDGT